MYEKQTWNTGDIITEEKLNHMEDGIAGASIPLYTPEVIGQHGGANYYQFFASVEKDIANIILIKQEDPNDLFKVPVLNVSGDDENIDTDRDEAIEMPIPGTWILNTESSRTMAINPIEDKSRYGFYLNEAISSANLYTIGIMSVVFMDHIPNLEYFGDNEEEPIIPITPPAN